jgi:hypothetical protein
VKTERVPKYIQYNPEEKDNQESSTKMEVLFWNINNRPGRPSTGMDVEYDREE